MSHTVYKEYDFKIQPLQPASDILIAELGEAGFESFVEEEHGILAYIQKSEWSSELLNDILILQNKNFDITYTIKDIEQENWNATWEKNFEAIQVDDKCIVRAPFHEKRNVEFDIVIEPKMSFGTGHHETTYMMLRHILENDFSEKSVLDMGSGTGVLAILAALKGAKNIDAIDIDNWCYLNAQENVVRNNCDNINVYEGDVGLLKPKQYDIIMANINRNILLADIPAYAKSLKANGMLFLSGFYRTDLPAITSKCKEFELNFVHEFEKNDWISAFYRFY
ncbi:50S ribosomal protein L11 methyltransferase [Costertonia aggregata]|uniref:Ribosomal protein L11 methyltransferase n=1 Tax=Costertonia aggregata TaxID=343403 RepID=A0A7H9AS26_9FLAO|nr:50S ribosomal protein L11 methyltransferase [Costertonia aggregata]QLG46207.1 50S ribosomal protein L11 methyltransferase [Costertonia aggregata]